MTDTYITPTTSTPTADALRASTDALMENMQRRRSPTPDGSEWALSMMERKAAEESAQIFAELLNIHEAEDFVQHFREAASEAAGEALAAYPNHRLQRNAELQAIALAVTHRHVESLK